MLTLDTDLAQALEQGSCSPVFIVEIYKGSSSSNEPLKFCTGDKPLRNVTVGSSTHRVQRIIPNIVTNIQAFGQTVDALKRSVTMSDTDITLIDDGQIRGMLDSSGAAIGSLTTDYHLLNSKVRILLGEQSLNISKFQSVGAFTVSEITPQEGSLIVSCKSLSNLCATFTVNRAFKARDPYAQLDQILRHTAALSDTQLDRDSYDPDYGYTGNTAPTVDPTKRHYGIRQDNNSAGDPEYYKTNKQPDGVKLWSLVGGISYVTRGLVFVSENGKITYVPYDKDKASVKHLTVSDIDTFEQSVMYSNVINRVTHNIKSVASKTDFDPWSEISAPNQRPNLTPIRRSTATYFGGVSTDTEFTTESTTAAGTFAYPDSGSSSVTGSNYFWQNLSESIDWCSGMTSCSFLRAPTICSSGDRSMRPLITDPAGSGTLYGKCDYTHSFTGPGSYGTLGRMAIGACLNVTEPMRADYIRCVTESGIPIPLDDLNPSFHAGLEAIRLQFNRGAYSNPGNQYDQSTLADKTFVPIQSPVIRIVDTSAAAQSDGVVAKEGLISRIDNSNGFSVLYIDWRHDNTTEFTANFSDSYDWIILEPQHPIFPDLTRRLLASSAPYDRRIGIIPRPHGVQTHSGGYGTVGSLTNDYQRYFYIQFAALAGFSGTTIRPQELPGVGYAYGVKLPKNMYRGPVAYMNVLQTDMSNVNTQVAAQLASWGIDGQYLYGHRQFAYPSSLAGQSSFAQLRPQERVTRESAGTATYANILLEYNEASSLSAPGAFIKREIIKCNQAYFAVDYGWSKGHPRPHIHPLPFAQSNQITGALAYVHRFSPEAAEPVSAFTGNRDVIGGSHLQQNIASCAVFRAEASSVTIDSDGAIKPSGRGTQGTKAHDYTLPPNLSAFVNHYRQASGSFSGGPGDPDEATPPNWFWVGLKATDVTIPTDVNQEILDRFAYGAPVVEITTNLRHIDIQLGDFITLDNDVYLRYGQNGTDEYTIFEVCRKEISLEGDSPRITFELCWVRQGSSANVPGGFRPPDGFVTAGPFSLVPIHDVEGRAVYDYSGDVVKGITKVASAGITIPPGEF